MAEFDQEYEKVNWKNRDEALTTPLDSDDLNNMDNFLAVLDRRTVDLGFEKAERSELEHAVTEVSVDYNAGIMHLDYLGGSSEDVYLYRIVPNAQYVTKIINDALNNFNTTSEAAINEAKEYANNANTSSIQSASNAFISNNNAEIAKSWAIGNEDARPNSTNDNAKYYSELAKQYAESYTGGISFKGSATFFQITNTLPLSSDLKAGDEYNVSDNFNVSTMTPYFGPNTSGSYPAGTNVVWSGNFWDVVAGPGIYQINLSGINMPDSTGFSQTTFKSGIANIVLDGRDLNIDKINNTPDDQKNVLGIININEDGESYIRFSLNKDTSITSNNISAIPIYCADKSNGEIGIITNTSANVFKKYLSLDMVENTPDIDKICYYLREYIEYFTNISYIPLREYIIKEAEIYYQNDSKGEDDLQIGIKLKSYQYQPVRGATNTIALIPFAQRDTWDANGNVIYKATPLIDLGFTGNQRWDTVYASTGTINTSDRALKKDISPISKDVARKLILGLLPSIYKMIDGTSGRTHWGFIAQDIEELLENISLTSLDFAGFIKTPKTKPVFEVDETTGKKTQIGEEIIPDQYEYSLRYTEFIAPMVTVIQDHEEKIEAIKNDQNDMKEMIANQNEEIERLKELIVNQNKEIEVLKNLIYGQRS